MTDPKDADLDTTPWDRLAAVTGDLVSMLGPGGRFHYASPNHLALTGRDPQGTGAIGPDWFHPDDVGRVYATLEAALHEGQRGALEYRLLRPDGGVQWLESRYSPWDARGGDPRVLVFSRLIDDVVATRQRLEESEARFRMLAEGASDVLWTSGLGLDLTYVSPAVEAHLGWTPADYLALDPADRFPPEELDGMKSAWRREAEEARRKAARGERHDYVMELRHRHRDGRLVWGEVHVSVTTGPGGRPAGLQGITRNIDGRKRAEEALARSEAHYRRLFDENRLGLAIADAVRDPAGRLVDARFVEVNRAYGHHTGLDAAGMVGRHISQVFGPEDLAHRLRVLEPVLAGTTHREEKRFGTLGRWLDVMTWALSPDRYVVMVEDVTVRRRLEEEAVRSQRVESIGLLAGGIAHDFNNLLTGILGNLSLIGMNVQGDPALSPLVESAEGACDRARDLTRQLLTFSRGGDPVRADTSLPELVRQAADFVMAGSSVSPLYDFPPSGLRALVDRGQFAQVVQNLVLNAVQAMPEGGHVHVGLDRVDLAEGSVAGLAPGPWVRLRIRDHGPGIAPENLPRLFDPYFTTRPGGSGLGLPVAYGIARRHGGTLTVESAPGQGATFTAYFPPGEPGAADARSAAPAPARRARVLLMDDDPSVREIMARMLDALGCEVASARDGAEAVEAWRRQAAQGAPFDLVLMDLTVPGGMGGKAAAQGILALDPGARIVVMSGYSNDPVMADHRAHGFVDVLPKPIKVPDLRALLDRLAVAAARA